MKIFDTHTHDYFDAFDENRDEMLEQCTKSGVEGKVQIGCNLSSSKEALSLAKKHKNMWATIGIHPCDAEKNNNAFPQTFENFQDIIENNSKKVVGIGETGFDFFHNDTPEIRRIQETSFLLHLQIAKKNTLPLIIHNRNANTEMITFLRENKTLLERENKSICGVFHCFSEDSNTATILTEELGFFLGIGGTATYKKNEFIRDAITNTPIDFLVTETDSPFLAPQKHRGKQNNSSYIIEIISLIAEIKKIPEEECAEILYANAKRLFQL